MGGGFDPLECGRSRETAQRSDLAGWAEYWYRASHSRYFWGLQLNLVCTLQGLPVGFALAGTKADERKAFLDILDGTKTMNAFQQDAVRQLLIGDKNYRGADFEDTVDGAGFEMLRPGPARASSRVPVPSSSGPCGRSSNPSRGSLAWNDTEAAPRPA